MARRPKSIGQRLAAKRKWRGQSLADAGVECGVSRQQFRKWELDEQIPDKDETILAAVGYLEIELTEWPDLVGVTERYRSRVRIEALQRRVDGLD